MARLGEIIPQMLVERGIDTVFGIPGVHTVEMYRGLPGSGLRHVTPRHEQGAGFMADGYARATGRVAACFIITGPGMTNIATAMGQAYADSIPMIVISSVNAEAHLGRGLGHLHELRDQSALIAGVAAWSRQVRDAVGLAEALDDALDLFAAARPRPVHIEIPIDRLSAEAGPLPSPRARARPPQASAAVVEQVAAQLHQAARPVLIAGGGAVGADVRALAEALSAPVILSSNARGLLPPDHPLLAGGVPYGAPQEELLARSDVALAIGAEFGDTDWSFYHAAPRTWGGVLIRVDIDPEPPANVAADQAIHADAAGFARLLLALLGRDEAEGGLSAIRAVPDLTACRSASGAALERRITRHLPLLAALWDAAPEAVIVGDSTEPAYAGLADCRPPGPRQWFTTATGFGTLGYGLPAAIGAGLALPDRPVIALAGDGGALYTLPELAAAVEAQVPVMLLIWNNNGYGEIRDFMQVNQIAPEGVDLSPVDFAALARGFGADYARARTLAEVCARIGHPRPQIVEIFESDWELA